MGRLGVLDTKLFGQALRMRWLWLSRADATRSWSLLPITEDDDSMALFRRSVQIEVDDGKAALIWVDPWLDGKTIAEVAPYLVAAVRNTAKNSRSVAEALHNRAWSRDAVAALTV
ncbi:hypothetical protein PR202_gb28663 [Eleusine coracana subsp. coracana]|uniref:Uncharacterized protein n=1 Tax=Eleusine coracana subsp. coracana TaxID=191504 RepID=A0AAV5FV23_ELECO|nr:hypothetical protein PR202_gb28663 [Eleusine coracana subsp. coracana]